MLDIHHEAEATADDHPNQCTLCKKLFSKKANLNKHLILVHGTSSTTSKNFIHCLEESCFFSCRDIASLRQHLIQEHEIDMVTENIKFQSKKGNYARTSMYV